MKTEHKIARCKGGINYRGYYFRRKGRWWIFKCDDDDAEIACTNIALVRQFGDWWEDTAPPSTKDSAAALRAWEIQFGTTNPSQAFTRLRAAEDAVNVLKSENRALALELRKSRKGNP